MQQRNPISRRRMLKRIGAGAAVVWTAPVLTSLRTPAFAASGACLGSGCVGCSFILNGSPGCQSATGRPCTGGLGCVYVQDTSGVCRNLQNMFCSCAHPCVNNSQCPAGWFCACSWPDCGISICVPCCGTNCF